MQENTQVRYISYSLFQHSAGCKNPVAHSCCASKQFGKKELLSLRYKMPARLIFTPAVAVLQDGG